MYAEFNAMLRAAVRHELQFSPFPKPTGHLLRSPILSVVLPERTPRRVEKLVEALINVGAKKTTCGGEECWLAPPPAVE